MFGANQLKTHEMEMAEIFKWIVENGGPAFVVVCALAWYIHRQSEKKDVEVTEVRKDNKDLVRQLIDDKEKRLIADQENRALLKSLIEKNGATTATMRESFARMEDNQRVMVEEIRELKLKLK